MYQKLAYKQEQKEYNQSVNSHLPKQVEIFPEKSLFARHFDVSDIAEGQNLAYEDTFEIVEQKNIIL
jgi:hypothetical protein